MLPDLSTLFDDLTRLCALSDSFYSIDQIGPDGLTYRTFTYRLASYTEFQQRGALECRGHTFRLDADNWTLASLPMQKFFNYGEHLAWGTPMDLSSVDTITDKLDGSLISTVTDSNNNFFLKSKTSFTSPQAIDATKWLAANTEFAHNIQHAITDGYTVNMEWISPNNRIVIGYATAKLVILNARRLLTGEYMTRKMMIDYFGEQAIVRALDIPNDCERFMESVAGMTGVEGFVLCLKNGLLLKHKTDAYCMMHRLKDSICSQRRLWEACLTGSIDDVRSMFADDPVTIDRINSMESIASKFFNHAHKTIYTFYDTNKMLSRKDYAIKGQAELKETGLFYLAMNLYLDKEANLIEHMIKHYKQYGITDEVLNTEN